MSYTVQKLPDAVIVFEITATDDLRGVDATQRQQIIMNHFADVLSVEKCAILTPPQMTILDENPLHFRVLFTTIPALKVPDYKKITILKESPKSVTKEDVMIVLRELQRTLADKVSSKDPIMKGDYVTLSYEARDAEEVVQMADQNYGVWMGAHTTVLAPFHDALYGLKIGDQKVFSLTFPADYFKVVLQNKPVTFSVTIKNVEKCTLQPFNDAFAEKVLGKGKKLTDLEQAITKDLELKRQKKVRHTQEKMVLDQIITQTTVDVPTVLIEQELTYLMEGLYKQAQKDGMNKEQYDASLQALGRDPRLQLRAQAKKNVILQLALDYLFSTVTEFVVTDAEITAQIEVETLKIVPEKRDAFRTEIWQDYDAIDSMKRRLQMQKLFNSILA